MKRLILAVTGLALVAAACGSGGAVAVRKIDSGKTVGPSPSAKNHAAFFSPPPVSSRASSRETSIRIPKLRLAFRYSTILVSASAA